MLHCLHFAVICLAFELPTLLPGGSACCANRKCLLAHKGHTASSTCYAHTASLAAQLSAQVTPLLLPPSPQTRRLNSFLTTVDTSDDAWTECPTPDDPVAIALDGSGQCGERLKDLLVESNESQCICTTTTTTTTTESPGHGHGHGHGQGQGQKSKMT